MIVCRVCQPHLAGHSPGHRSGRAFLWGRSVPTNLEYRETGRGTTHPAKLHRME